MILEVKNYPKPLIQVIWVNLKLAYGSLLVFFSQSKKQTI